MTAVAYDLWRPTSGCGPDCLPEPGAVPAVPAVVRAGRLAAVLAMLVAGAGLVLLLPLLPTRERHAAVRGWARLTTRAFGVRVVVRGRLPRRRALLVANHESWLDILAVLAVAPARMIAKREVRAWPLIGPVAGAVGTVFVDRGRPRNLPVTVGRVAEALRSGRSVAVFPEGTTWCGDGGCRPGGGFRPAVFQAAIDAGAPVVPLRVAYRCAATGAGTTAAAFVGDENLWRSVRRVVAARSLVVEVSVTAALHPARDADRRVLARAAEAAVHLVPSPSAGLHPAARPVPVARAVTTPTPAWAPLPGAAVSAEPARELDLAA